MTDPDRSTGLRGCIPILVTPFLADGALDLASLEQEIEWALEEGAAGLATLALASEGYKLTESERDQVTQWVTATVAGRVPVIVSADGAGVEIAIDRALRAQMAGADALMVLPPSFVKPDAGSLSEYYTRIGSSVRIPLIIQDAPQLTGVAMGPALWASLAETVPTIQYVKVEGTPQGPAISGAIAQSEGRLSLFCGWGGLSMLDALERGAVGSMPAVNFTRRFVEIQARYEAGDQMGAAAAFAAELPYLLWTMQSLDHSVAAAKEELRRRGIIASAVQRGPALSLDAVARQQLAAFISDRSPAGD